MKLTVVENSTKICDRISDAEPFSFYSMIKQPKTLKKADTKDTEYMMMFLLIKKLKHTPRIVAVQSSRMISMLVVTFSSNRLPSKSSKDKTVRISNTSTCM